MADIEFIDWKTLGAAIKKARKESHKLQPELAEHLGLPQSAISFAETGNEGRISLEKVKHIAESVGVDWKAYRLPSPINPAAIAAVRYCRNPGCPAAFPVLLDNDSGQCIRMAPFSFESSFTKCPYCREEGFAANDEKSSDWSADWLESTPGAYNALLKKHASEPILLLDSIKDYYEKKLSLAGMSLPDKVTRYH